MSDELLTFYVSLSLSPSSVRVNSTSIFLSMHFQWDWRGGKHLQHLYLFSVLNDLNWVVFQTCCNRLFYVFFRIFRFFRFRHIALRALVKQLHFFFALSRLFKVLRGWILEAETCCKRPTIKLTQTRDLLSFDLDPSNGWNEKRRKKLCLMHIFNNCNWSSNYLISM